MTSRRLGRVLIAILLAPVMSALASDEPRPPIKTIGIVSDLGDKVAVQHIGFMAFSNSRVVQDVPDWAIDAHVTSALSDALKASYDLKAVNFPRGGIAPELGRMWHSPSPDDNMRSNSKPADGQPIDAYVVAWPFRLEVYPTNQTIEGIGLLTQGPTSRLYISVMVSLVDGHTYKAIDQCVARVKERSFWNPDEHFMTKIEGYDDMTSFDFDAMTPEQQQTVQAGLKQMLTLGMANCASDLKLVPSASR